MEQMRAELASSPPLPGSYVPKRGELCAAKFVDSEWYRARVEKVEGNNVVSILYIDYGNVSCVHNIVFSNLYFIRINNKENF